jgi:ATP-dependent DNA helicase RecQ
METLLLKYQNHFPEIHSLYEYQLQVLTRLKKRDNTLAIIPTGGGKSLIYQLMALELEGVTLVISPLLALMEEQVNELNDKRAIPALALNSNISFNEQREILRNLDHTYRLIYISPERLQNPFFKASLIASGIKISMIVVDEAHCISQWGSNFRPDYGQINGFIKFLNQKSHYPFLLCLTATLSDSARKDIATEFLIRKENIVIKDVIRQNLKLHFKEVQHEDEKSDCLREFITQYQPNKTIAYLYSKQKCEDFANEFDHDFRTNFYHASVDYNEKKVVYTDFINNELDILFATTAFGMGINIPDIDSVIHLQIPNSVEEYYQQVGRGWRKKNTEKDCQCLAIWSETNFDRRLKEIRRQKYTVELLQEAFKTLTGGAILKKIGQVVNKDKDALSNSKFNLQLVKYKLEKYNVINTIGEINGSPLTIELRKNTPLWKNIIESAQTMDSFGYVSRDLSLPITNIIEHLYQQDLSGNIKKLPAMKKDVYFELLALTLEDNVAAKIVNEINLEIDFKIERLNELRELFTCDDPTEMLNQLLS